VKLARYDTYTVKRQSNAADYTGQLSKLPGVIIADPAHCHCAAAQEKALEAARAKVVLPIAYPHNDHIWNQYTLRVIGAGRRDLLKKHLIEQGIGCEIYYPLTMDQQDCFQYVSDAGRSDCEVAHRLASEALSIPIYPELQAEQRAAVIAAIGGWLRE